MSQPLASGLFVVLTLATASMAVAVVFSKHESRRLFVQSRELSAQIDEYVEAWSRLQLEYGTLANQAKIELVAREKLDMALPAFTDVRIVK